MSQAVADQQTERADMFLLDMKRTMKKNPHENGISAWGYDGVLRTFDNERNFLDAVGLSLIQIREH